MEKYLHIVLNNFTNDSRILRQCISLYDEKKCNIKIFALHDEGQLLSETINGNSCIEVFRFSLTTRSWPKIIGFQIIKYFECWLRMYYKARAEKPSCIQANDLSALPIACTISWKLNIPLIYDAHELETEVNGLKPGSMLQKLMVRVESTLIHRPQNIITVSDSIAEWYKKKYDIPKPIVVRNTPPLLNREVIPFQLKSKLGISENDLLFIYLGFFSKGRGIPNLLEIFKNAHSNKHIVFMGRGALQPLIEEFTCLYNNVHYYPIVPSDEVARYAAGADIGVCLLENVSLSDYYSLPNKVFEYIAAGLPICVNDFPEQLEFVNSYNCGWILDGTIDDSVNFVNTLTYDQLLLKTNGVEHARDTMNWEKESVAYLQVVDSVIGKKID